MAKKTWTPGKQDRVVVYEPVDSSGEDFLDEIVLSQVQVHVEHMQDDSWWLGFSTVDGRRFTCYAKDVFLYETDESMVPVERLERRQAEPGEEVYTPCFTCGHAAPHSAGGIGVCVADDCGCDGPVEDRPVPQVFRVGEEPTPRDVVLVNASRETLHVLEGKRVSKLLRVPEPEAILAPGKTVRGVLRDAKGGLYDWVEEHEVPMVTNVPPRIDKVLYIVEPEVLGQFPHREDFVSVAMYTLYPVEKKSEKKKGKKGKVAVKYKSVVSALTRSPYATATEGTPSLESLMEKAEMRPGPGA